MTRHQSKTCKFDHIVYHEDDLTITCVDKSTAVPSQQTTVPTTKASTSTTTKRAATTTTAASTTADVVDPNNTPITSKSTPTSATTTNEAVTPRSEESKSNGGTANQLLTERLRYDMVNWIRHFISIAISCRFRWGRISGNSCVRDSYIGCRYYTTDNWCLISQICKVTDVCTY